MGSSSPSGGSSCYTASGAKRRMGRTSSPAGTASVPPYPPIPREQRGVGPPHHFVKLATCTQKPAAGDPTLPRKQGGGGPSHLSDRVSSNFLDSYLAVTWDERGGGSPPYSRASLLTMSVADFFGINLGKKAKIFASFFLS